MSKYIRPLIIILGIALASTLIFWLVYDFEFRKDYISNSIFVISISVFFISLIMHTGATRLFLGISYTSKTWINSKKTREEYPTFREYFEEKSKSHVKYSLDVIVISLIYLLIAFALINL